MTETNSSLPKQNFNFAIKSILGYRNDLKQSIYQHKDNTSYIYPGGNAIIINNIDSKQQFLTPYPGTKGITCITQSPSKRYLAWAEESTSGIIVIYDFLRPEKRKIITTQDCKSSSYIALDFSKSDETKYLIALSSLPDCQLFYIQWNKQKIISSVQIKQMSINLKFINIFFHPKEEDFIGLLGNSQIRSYKLCQDLILRQKDQPFTKIKYQQNSYNYLSYCILQDENMLVGTDSGEILLFNSQFEFKLILSQSPINEGFSIECITQFSEGFLVGSNNSNILIFVKSDIDIKNPYIRLDKKIQIKDFPSKIISLLLTPNQDKLYIGTDNNQLLYASFSSEISAINEENLLFEPCISYFHQQKITSLDVCIRKYLIVTCSIDKSVKIWNYKENAIESQTTFDEEAYSVSFHPSGLYIIVSFIETIKLLNIYQQQLISFKELHVRNCKDVKFSNGGGLFVVNNFSTIQVYQFQTGEKIENLNFQGAGRVRCFFWDEDDLGFFTGNSEGNVFFWKIDELSPQKTQILSIQGLQIQSISALQHVESGNLERIVFVSGQQEEKCIYRIHIQTKQDKEARDFLGDAKKIYVISHLGKILVEDEVCCMKIMKNREWLMYSCGIRVQFMRIFQEKERENVKDIQGNFKKVNCLGISYDDFYAFSGGEEGCLVIYENKKKDQNDVLLSEDFLMKKENFEKIKEENNNLKEQIKAEKLKLVNIQNEKERIIEEKISELKNVKIQRENIYKQAIEDILNEKNQKNQNFENQIEKNKESHQKNREIILNEYKRKIQMQTERKEKLFLKKKNEQIKFKSEQHKIISDFQKQFKEKTQQFEDLLTNEKEKYQNLYQKRQILQLNFEKMRNRIECEAEEQIEKLKMENDNNMNDLFLNLEKNEIKKMEKKSNFEIEAQKLEEQKNKLKKIIEDINQIQDTNKMLLKEKDNNQRDILDRENAINDKSKRIYELKQKTQELEKFKFVLDYKIKELKRDIGPKEEEIMKMKEQISNMNSEIQHFIRTNNNLLLIVNDLKLRQKGMKQELINQQKSINQNEQYIKLFEQEISNTHSEIYVYIYIIILFYYYNIKNFKNLKQKAINLYKQYVQGDELARKRIQNNNKQKEINKERIYLEKSVSSLKLKHDKIKLQIKMYKILIYRNIYYQKNTEIIMKHNTFLIFEINYLRKDMKSFVKEIEKNKQEAELKELVNFKDYQILEKYIQQLEDNKKEIIKNIEEQKKNNELLKSKKIINIYIYIYIYILYIYIYKYQLLQYFLYLYKIRKTQLYKLIDIKQFFLNKLKQISIFQNINLNIYIQIIKYTQQFFLFFQIQIYIILKVQLNFLFLIKQKNQYGKYNIWRF
ncbi:WD repeat protein [Ichthyophthirius multifiliis]|uniref:WD repeat protein n=1 Tax=Ichthyophthirius multifiliis TaxID=5932 RepID=G0QSL8_ICHMU|nr:WD repeat protein [Ichthyophthirius multifiliis]EGR31777.1 WD repeat protein [Ichthyophthirius multifiliis]|eukprot:XP_004035263.1 WD repeat protein [Ichthyophthirius multifiliis]